MLVAEIRKLRRDNRKLRNRLVRSSSGSSDLRGDGGGRLSTKQTTTTKAGTGLCNVSDSEFLFFDGWTGKTLTFENFEWIVDPEEYSNPGIFRVSDFKNQFIPGILDDKDKNGNGNEIEFRYNTQKYMS